MPKTVLIADDDPSALLMAEAWLSSWGYETISVSDGKAALAVLMAADAPSLALIDWMMPGLDGPEVCRQLRAGKPGSPCHLMLITARGATEDVAAGLDAGADDYLTKPIDPIELRARLNVGVRLTQLQRQLRDRVHELETARATVRELSDLLPICSYCHQVRNDDNYWQRLDEYLMLNADMTFSHGMCPGCEKKHWPELAEI